MSVDIRRRVAQRTAAKQSGTTSRRRLAATWLVAATGLSLFGFTVLASAGTFSHPDYAGALRKLPKGQAVVLVTGSGSSGLIGRFTHAYSDKELCVVTNSQLARIQGEYQVDHMSIPV